MADAILAGAMLVPKELVPARTLKELTIKYARAGEPIIKVRAFTDEGEYWGLPRQYGMKFCKQERISWEDHTQPGYAVDFPSTGTPRDYQVDVLDDLEAMLSGEYDFLFKAHTGWGKTMGALITAARVGVTTCIVVDTDDLRIQWEKAAGKLGLTYDNGLLGRMQGQHRDWKGKAVVISTVQTLTKTEVDPEFFDEFGLVFIDETHIIGAMTFSQILYWFNATYRIGISATPRRKDGLQPLLEWHLGEVKIAAKQKHDRSAVYFSRSPTIYSAYGNFSPKMGRIITEIAEDGRRNLMLCESIKWLWETGRDVLVLGDRTGQLRHLSSLLYYMGVPDKEMGVFAGADPFYAYAKQAKRGRLPFGITRFEGEYEGDELAGEFVYSPIELQLISKKPNAKRMAHVKEKCSIIFATYGIAAKGFDAPRLAGGVDATPRSEAEQIHGRILRKVTGKHVPIWVTTYDDHNYRLCRSFETRVRTMAKSNAAVFEWTEEGEVIPCQTNDVLDEAHTNFLRLKEMTIEPGNDGSNTLRTRASLMKPRGGPARATGARTRSAPQSSNEVSPRAVSRGRSNTRIAPGRSSSKPTASPRRPRR